jgi:hypothetical protein
MQIGNEKGFVQGETKKTNPHVNGTDRGST